MASRLVTSRPIRIAVEGCGHGTLNSIYASIVESCKLKGWSGIDLLIIGGDFQAVRNPHDLNCMSVPVKYREIGDFHDYYSGRRTAPYLTIFVGGNHEASNYLFELYYGGWVAPNIYYLGAANVVRLGGLRIASLSGIWKGFDYRKPHIERLPYNENDVKSIYHVRELDVRKLLQIRTQVDVGISHDWPKGVEWKGDWKSLFQKKGHFEADARSGRLGSEAAKHVMNRLRPKHWFSAHLHIKYAAIVHHAPNGEERPRISDGANGEQLSGSMAEPARNEEEILLDLDGDTDTRAKTTNMAQPANDDEIELDLDEEMEDSTVSSELRAQLPAAFSRPLPPATLPFPSDITNETTNFLALDKCLPHRDFLQLLEIPSATSISDDIAPLQLEYDPEWLAITRALHAAHTSPPYLSLGHISASAPPDKGEAAYRPLIEVEEAWVQENLVSSSKMTIPLNFDQTASAWDASQGDWRKALDQPREYANPQTKQYCAMLEISNPFDISEEEALNRMANGPAPSNAISRGRGSHGWRGRGRGRGGDRGHRGDFRGGPGRGRGRGGRW